MLGLLATTNLYLGAHRLPDLVVHSDERVGRGGMRVEGWGISWGVGGGWKV